MAREALAIWIVLSVRAVIPTPLPPPETEIETVGSTLAYASAQANARLTMVSEPRLMITLLEELLEELDSEQAEIARQRIIGSSRNTRLILQL